MRGRKDDNTGTTWQTWTSVEWINMSLFIGCDDVVISLHWSMICLGKYGCYKWIRGYFSLYYIWMSALNKCQTRKEPKCLPPQLMWQKITVWERKKAESIDLSAPEDDKVRATGSVSVPDTHQCQDKRLALHLFWVVTPHADLSVCLHMVVGFNFSHSKWRSTSCSWLESLMTQPLR